MQNQFNRKIKKEKLGEVMLDVEKGKKIKHGRSEQGKNKKITKFLEESGCIILNICVKYTQVKINHLIFVIDVNYDQKN